MADLAGTASLIRQYLNARVPLIVIRTIEPARATSILADCATTMRAMAFYQHSRTEGLRDMATGHMVSDDLSLASALEQARSTFKARPNVNFVFHDVEDVHQESSTSRHFAEMARLADTRQGSIILIVDSAVWSGLSRLGMSVTLDLPTRDEMFDLVAGMMDDHRRDITIEWGEAEVSRAAEILTGVTEMEAVNSLAAILATGRVANDHLSELARFKDQIIGDLQGIERVHLEKDYQVGGLSELRDWLAKREILMKADLSRTPLHPPRGILLVGVPGCGKSLSAKAIAFDWGLPLYRLDLGAVLGMYVGQSESQLREALETADRVAPCVLWIDEIEKGLASGGGDGGVSRRLVGQFLYWLQESSSKVFIVATANDVASLPPELLRKGRFDEMFFVDLPEAAERAEILSLYFHKYLSVEYPTALLEDLVDASQEFSGSDIEAVVHDIATDKFTAGRAELPPHDVIVRYFRGVVPYSQTNPEDVAAIRSWGRGRCLPASRTTATQDVATGTLPGRRVIVSLEA